MKQILSKKRLAKVKKFLITSGACRGVMELFLKNQDITIVRIKWFCSILSETQLKQVFPDYLVPYVLAIKDYDYLSMEQYREICYYMQNNLINIYNCLKRLGFIERSK